MGRLCQHITNILYFLDKTPQEIRDEREEHYKSDDRKVRYYYEDKLEEFRQFLIDHHYGAGTIKAYLGRVAGLFSNNRLDLLLDKSFWAKLNKDSSETAQALETTKRYPDNDEMRLIVELADNRHIILLYGPQKPNHAVYIYSSLCFLNICFRVKLFLLENHH